MRRTLTLLTAVSAAAVFVASSQLTAHAAAMYDRVCPRVINRFANDPHMWQRVNDRIENRFGFRCQPADDTATRSSLSPITPLNSILPPAPSTTLTKRQQQLQDALDAASRFKQQAQKSSEAARSMQQLCQWQNWECGEFSACMNYLQRRTCRPPHPQCREMFSPATVQGCGPSYHEVFEQLRRDILERAMSYKNQGPAAYNGLARLDGLDTQLVYIYNANRFNPQLAHPSLFDDIRKEFDSLPMIYY